MILILIHFVSTWKEFVGRANKQHYFDSYFGFSMINRQFKGGQYKLRKFIGPVHLFFDSVDLFRIFLWKSDIKGTVGCEKIVKGTIRFVFYSFDLYFYFLWKSDSKRNSMLQKVWNGQYILFFLWPGKNLFGEQISCGALHISIRISYFSLKNWQFKKGRFAAKSL
jgi:hypothetical protein